MDENIQHLHLPIFMKNINIPTEFEYQKALVFRIDDFIKRLRWHCLFIGAPTFNPVMYEKTQEKVSSQNLYEKCLSQTQHENL